MIRVLNLEEIKNLFPEMKGMKEAKLTKKELEVIFNLLEESGEYQFISLMNNTTKYPLFILRKL